MKIVIIGNGMVGYKFCEKLLAKADQNEFEITVFGEEIHPAYDRVHLSGFFSGKTVCEPGHRGTDHGPNVDPFPPRCRQTRAGRGGHSSRDQ